MANRIKIKVGEVEYEGDKEFAREELPDLIASLAEASGNVPSAPQEVQPATATVTSEDDSGLKSDVEDSEQVASDSIISSFEDLPTLLHEANRSTDQDTLLAATAFLQESEGREGLTNKEINEELRPLGEDIDRIDSASAGLKKKGHFLRVGKEGRYNQHKVTPDGLDEVKALLREEEK